MSVISHPLPAKSPPAKAGTSQGELVEWPRTPSRSDPATPRRNPSARSSSPLLRLPIAMTLDTRPIYLPSSVAPGTLPLRSIHPKDRQWPDVRLAADLDTSFSARTRRYRFLGPRSRRGRFLG